VFTTKGMKEVGEISTLNPGELWRIAGRTLTNQWFLIGLASMTVSFVSFLTVLSWADLSLVLPATSISFVVTAIGAKWYLKEHISPVRWTGIVLVCAGVALLSLP
jgi:uncharacterized membrane protein